MIPADELPADVFVTLLEVEGLHVREAKKQSSAQSVSILQIMELFK